LQPSSIIVVTVNSWHLFPWALQRF